MNIQDESEHFMVESGIESTEHATSVYEKVRAASPIPGLSSSRNSALHSSERQSVEAGASSTCDSLFASLEAFSPKKRPRRMMTLQASPIHDSISLSPLNWAAAPLALRDHTSGNSDAESPRSNKVVRSEAIDMLLAISPSRKRRAYYPSLETKVMNAPF